MNKVEEYRDTFSRIGIEFEDSIINYMIDHGMKSKKEFNAGLNTLLMSYGYPKDHAMMIPNANSSEIIISSAKSTKDGLPLPYISCVIVIQDDTLCYETPEGEEEPTLEEIEQMLEDFHRPLMCSVKITRYTPIIVGQKNSPRKMMSCFEADFNIQGEFETKKPVLDSIFDRPYNLAATMFGELNDLWEDVTEVCEEHSVKNAMELLRCLRELDDSPLHECSPFMYTNRLALKRPIEDCEAAVARFTVPFYVNSYYVPVAVHSTTLQDF